MCDSHGDIGDKHKTLDGFELAENKVPVVLIGHRIHRLRCILSLKVVELWQRLRPEVVAETAKLLLELTEAAFDFEAMSVKLNDFCC